jgi:hypothetical protein
MVKRHDRRLGRQALRRVGDYVPMWFRISPRLAALVILLPWHGYCSNAARTSDVRVTVQYSPSRLARLMA